MMLVMTFDSCSSVDVHHILARGTVPVMIGCSGIRAFLMRINGLDILTQDCRFIESVSVL